jgi:hypothetical protein
VLKLENKTYLNKIYKVEYYDKLPPEILKEHIQWTGSIIQYDMNGNFINEFRSARSAGSTLNIPHGNIIQCLHDKRKSAGGFLWKYKDCV